MTNEEAIEIIKIARAEVEWEYPMDYAAAFDKAIEALEQEPKWIPVSERLPEAGKQYLCCNEDGFREVGYLSKVTGEWGFTDTEAFGEVIAWMPLPEPYTGESEE